MPENSTVDIKAPEWVLFDAIVKAVTTDQAGHLPNCGFVFDTSTWSSTRCGCAEFGLRLLGALRDTLPTLLARDTAATDTDAAPLGEDVTFHCMWGPHVHPDGRTCFFHARLGVWAFEGTSQCLRADHPEVH